jgi:L-lactate oxidase
MTTSRRNLIQALAAGGAAIATAQRATKALAQVIPPVPPVNVPGASAEEHELKIVNIELLEDEARKILAPGRFAFMGPAGDGWTYRENRRAFNDFPIMPRRLQGVGEDDIDLRTTLLGHGLLAEIGRVSKRSTAMSNKSIATIATMGIDIGKNSFHVVGLDRRGRHKLDDSATASAGGRRVVLSGQATVVCCDEQTNLDTRTTRLPFACPSCARLRNPGTPLAIQDATD